MNNNFKKVIFAGLAIAALIGTACHNNFNAAPPDQPIVGVIEHVDLGTFNSWNGVAVPRTNDEAKAALMALCDWNRDGAFHVIPDLYSVRADGSVDFTYKISAVRSEDAVPSGANLIYSDHSFRYSELKVQGAASTGLFIYKMPPTRQVNYELNFMFLKLRLTTDVGFQACQVKCVPGQPLDLAFLLPEPPEDIIDREHYQPLP
ncbi:MAG: hypothetical protein LBR79_07465 [Oscillospiraceae bacterium]|jgi:hypothetical protein|nr:hypothetical protein [Oscillospiraceae bacterium]